MREFAKSAVSCAWAMSVFGIQQVLNVFAPGADGQGSKAAEAFDKLTEVTTQEMGDSLRITFRLADKLQRGVVDLVCSVPSLDAVSSVVNRPPAPSSNQPAPVTSSVQGWGPMP
jgi:hypothetical protein